MKRDWCLLPLLAVALAAAEPQTSTPPDEKQRTMQSLERMARVITDRAAEEIATRDAWEKVRVRRLEEMRDMLGLLPWPKRTPLNVRITGKIDKDEYVIEKIAFESLPKFYVTGNLYLPKNVKGRAPAVVYVCGHSNSPYGAKAQYQRHGISFAKNGYVCFILDPIQIAETWAAHHGVMWQEMLDWYSRGYTPAGPETWNVIRAIDYLETRPEVDKERIGVTGRSGGAAMSWFPASIDPRIKLAAPIMGISTYAADVRENTQRLHCDCMFPINSWMHDMMHQGALIAPRPLLMGHGSKDALFPVAGYTEFEQRVGALYAAYGAQDRFRNVVVPTAHADSDFLRETVLRWFDRFFLRQPDRKLDMAYVNEEPVRLAVFPEGPPADAQNFRVHEFFTTRAPSPRYASRAQWEKRREALLAELRAKVFAASADHFEPRMEVRAAPKDGRNLPGLVYVASEGEDSRSINGLLNQVREGVRVVVYPRGTGEAPWDRSAYKEVLRNAMFVGHTVDSLRLGDVRAAVAKLRAQPGVDPTRIMIMGRGVSGALGLYAAILDPVIAQVMLLDPPESHAAGPIFLNVMRYTDLPEAAALLAPRPLSFYARMPQAFEYTRHVYKLYGKDLFRGMSIQGVLKGRYDHNFGSGI